MATATPPRRAVKKRRSPRSKTPPVSAETSPRDAKVAEMDRTNQIKLLAPDTLVDHPANPRDRVSPPAVADLMESIKQFGQREPVRARVIDENKAQILSGHRRVAACRILRRDVRVELVVCTDAEALREVMLGNADRKDLDPVERAELLERMIASGIERDEAGAMFGLASESGIKNALRISKLPESIKKLLRDGTIPARSARYLVPYSDMPKVLDAFAKDLCDSYGDTLGHFLNSPKECTVALVTIDGRTNGYGQRPVARPVDGTKYRYDYNHQEAKCGFELTPAIRKKLKIVEVPIDGEMVQVATNVKLFDKLNEEHLVKKKAYNGSPKKKTKATKKAKLTPAQEKAEVARKKKVAAERLKNSLPVWATRFRRCLLSFETRRGCGIIEASLPWIVMQMSSDRTWLKVAVESQSGKIKGGGAWHYDETKTLAALIANPGVCDGAWRALVWPQRRIAWHDVDRISGDVPVDMPLNPKSSSFHKIWPMLIEAARLSITDAWNGSATRSSPLNPLVREYLNLHSADQLQTLARSSKTKVTQTAKGKLVDELLECHAGKPLPLPKCLQSRGGRK